MGQTLDIPSCSVLGLGRSVAGVSDVTAIPLLSDASESRGYLNVSLSSSSPPLPPSLSSVISSCFHN